MKVIVNYPEDTTELEDKLMDILVEHALTTLTTEEINALLKYEKQLVALN
ncbi:hypothetical protein ACQPUQ_16965 [Clostridium paraputrificum]